MSPEPSHPKFRHLALEMLGDILVVSFTGHKIVT
jgi:hypothetical protein